MVNPSTIGSVTLSLWKNLAESENGSKTSISFKIWIC